MRPFVRTARNSLPARNLAEAGKRCDSGSGMAGVVHLNALRQQPLASAGAAPVENGAAALGLHAGAKSELPLARALRRLISAFHKPEIEKSRVECFKILPRSSTHPHFFTLLHRPHSIARKSRQLRPKFSIFHVDGIRSTDRHYGPSKPRNMKPLFARIKRLFFFFRPRRHRRRGWVSVDGVNYH